jgi:mono/diheme cytochrome c family protein
MREGTREKAMKAARVGSLIIVGSLVVWFSAAAQNRAAKKGGPDQVQLIDSIQGPALYKTYCAVCHGSDGKGHGPMAIALKAKTPDLTLIAKRNGGKFPRMRIMRIISGEESLPGGHGTREMPVWGPIFSKVERDQDRGPVRIDNLARYLEQIQAK